MGDVAVRLPNVLHPMSLRDMGYPVIWEGTDPDHPAGFGKFRCICKWKETGWLYDFALDRGCVEALGGGCRGSASKYPTSHVSKSRHGAPCHLGKGQTRATCLT